MKNVLDFEDTLVMDKLFMIWEAESSIDIDEDVYMLTWSPDPKEMPDTDFYLQHQTNVNLLSDYLRFCSNGLFCVESTQLGNPHYHGWYQVDDMNEIGRIAMVKTLQRFGNLKENKVERSYKIHSWIKQSNALFYYKVELLHSMIDMQFNPISRDTRCTVDWSVLKLVGFLDKSSRKNTKTIEDRMTDIEFYKNFYSDTIGYLNS